MGHGIGSAISDAVSSVGDFIGDVVGGVADAFTSVVGAAADVVGGIMGAAGDLVGGVIEGAGDLVGDIVGGVGDALTWVGDMVEDLFAFSFGDDPATKDYASAVAVLQEHKGVIQSRRGSVGDYFSTTRQMAGKEYGLRQQSGLDKFLADSYNLDVTRNQELSKSNVASLEDQYQGEKVFEQAKKSYLTEKESNKLSFEAGQLERRKGEFDQMSALVDQLYSINTAIEELEA